MKHMRYVATFTIFAVSTTVLGLSAQSPPEVTAETVEQWMSELSNRRWCAETSVQLAALVNLVTAEGA